MYDYPQIVLVNDHHRELLAERANRQLVSAARAAPRRPMNRPSSVRRWATGLALAVALTLGSSGCASETDALRRPSLPAGDAARGAALFTQAVNGAPPCATCHTVDGTPGLGPTLDGFGAAAGSRAADVSAEDYAWSSVVEPGRHLAPGYGNLMYPGYGAKLSPQDLSDLIAYVLTE